MKKILIGLVVLIGLGALFGGGSSEEQEVSGTKESKPKYEFVEEPTMTDGGYGTYYIEGVIKNNTSFDKDYIQVSFTLYDADGNNLGTALANTNNLKADGTWKFKAMGISTSAEVESFELDEVTGF